jgi:hypothetical protein
MKPACTNGGSTEFLEVRVLMACNKNRALLAPGRPEGRGPPDGRRAVRSTVGVRCATVALKKKSRKKSRRNIRPYCMQHDEGNSQHSKATSATFKK